MILPNDTRRSERHAGFTLVELLVVMGIIVFLAALAMLTVPGIMQKNRSIDASTQLEVWLHIARAKAQRDQLPRGLRLIMNGTTFVTEVQYIEAPPVFVPNLDPPYPNGLTGAFQPHPLSPRVEFYYFTNGTGTITNRQCLIRGLTQDQASQIINAFANGQQARLWLPVLGTWHPIISAGLVTGTLLAPDTNTPGNSFCVELIFDPNPPSTSFPDAQLGIAVSPNSTTPAYRTYHFGIYLPPRPLFGDSAMQLPTNTCIDLSANVSSPNGQADLAAGRDFDILFAPSGHLAYTSSTLGAGHVFLWIRDPRKVASMDAVALGGYGSAGYTQALENGGEQMIVAIKATGATAVAPVYWPTTATETPYFLAQKAVAGP